MAANGSYIYASYSTSSTIGTFSIEAGCELNFVSDILAFGLNNGDVNGMAVHENLLVVSYGDGSIGTFDITGGAPVSATPRPWARSRSRTSQAELGADLIQNAANFRRSSFL